MTIARDLCKCDHALANHYAGACQIAECPCDSFWPTNRDRPESGEGFAYHPAGSQWATIIEAILTAKRAGSPVVEVNAQALELIAHVAENPRPMAYHWSVPPCEHCGRQASVEVACWPSTTMPPGVWNGWPAVQDLLRAMGFEISGEPMTRDWHITCSACVRDRRAR